MEKLRQCRNNYRKGGCFDGKKHSEKEKTILDSPSPKLNKSMIAYHETGDLFADTCEIVESAQSIAYAAVDTILVQRNWLSTEYFFTVLLPNAYVSKCRTCRKRNERTDCFL